jgi:hypothetical protein
MLDGYRVVATIPAGRQRYLETLVPYLLSQRHILDECHFWCNTSVPEDIAYLYQLADQFGFMKVIAPEIPVAGIRSIHHFFLRCVDNNTLYVRFDDDICWIAPNAVEELLHFLLANPRFPLVVANTINNSICSYIHQRLGCLNMTQGCCTYDVFGDVNWKSGPFARLAHETFLKKLEDGELADYHFRQWIALTYERISINCIAWSGRHFALFGGNVGLEEEHWLTVVLPMAMKRPVAICGTALVAHFAYHPQRQWVEEYTDLLGRYREKARHLVWDPAMERAAQG